MLLRVPEYIAVSSPSAAGYGWIISEQQLDMGRSEIDDYLAQIVAREERVNLTFRPLNIAGDVAGSIIDTAKAEQADLIVMTTHGYSGLTRWMLGSVTEKVLRGAACPVLVVRFDRPLKHTLITLDGSQIAEEILNPAMELACRLSEQVTLLRVDHEEKLSALEVSLLEMADSELCKEIQAHPEKRISYYLDCIAQSFSAPDLKLETAVVKGSPADVILEYADAHEVDLIAMATHGYTGLRRWVYGSVTEKILHRANCAMLIVRPPEDLLKT